MSITVKSSIDNDIIDSFFKEIHELDESVYDTDLAGETEPMKERFMKNRNSYIYLWDNEKNIIVGYINYFPVTAKLKEKILSPYTDSYEIDDGIKPEHIVSNYNGNNMMIFILSLVIKKEYQNIQIFDSEGKSKRCINLLIEAFKTKIRDVNEKKPRTVTSIAGLFISDAGKKVAISMNFRFHHCLESCEKHAVYICGNPNGGDNDEIGKDLQNFLKYGPYIKTYKDDAYLFMPLTENRNNTFSDNLSDIDKKNLSPEDASIFSTIKNQLIENLKYEYNGNIVDKIDIICLGCFNFLHTNDQYTSPDVYDPIHDEEELSEDDINHIIYSYSDNSLNSNEKEGLNTEIVIGHQKGYVFIAKHRPSNMYVAIVFLPDYKFSISQLEDQLTKDYIKIVDPYFDDEVYKISHNYRYLRLYDYLWLNYRLHKCGQEKILICMNHKPDETINKTEFQNIMASEVYNSIQLDYHIDSPIYQDIINQRQYNYYDAYFSKSVIAFIPNDYEKMDIVERISVTSTFLFILIPVIFQNTSIARMNSKIIDALSHNGDMEMNEILYLEQEYGKTIAFWDLNNFKYPGTQAEANCIIKSFENNELRETYNKHQEFLENIVNLKSSERDNKNDTILNIAAFILAIIQIESFFTDILTRFYTNFLDIEVDASYIGFEKTFSNTILNALLLFVMYLIIKKRHSKKKKAEKKI